MALGRQC